ncbi:MAG: His-Xaa-Ser system protein HxsD [Candidatus Gracilibacteria bacterium]|nr:His-Xaa-Ser system protein HxsD [Candidatus Gracilibacteria bacterium]
MENFLSHIIEGVKFELVIDKDIFNKDIVLKAAYNFLERGYFFFKLNNDGNIVLVFTKREDNTEKPENIIADFSDELLSVYLRDKLEKENKTIREAIVGAAIANSLDSNNFVQINTDSNNTEQNQIDFDKDIDDILREIENDPDLKIDEEEIERILKEIEEESELEGKKPMIKVDLDGFKKAKEQFIK